MLGQYANARPPDGTGLLSQKCSWDPIEPHLHGKPALRSKAGQDGNALVFHSGQFRTGPQVAKQPCHFRRDFRPLRLTVSMLVKSIDVSHAVRPDTPLGVRFPLASMLPSPWYQRFSPNVGRFGPKTLVCSKICANAAVLSSPYMGCSELV
jgi:hypothetical protein